MKIFYHKDLDGECAAHVIDGYERLPRLDKTFYPINYGMEFPMKDIKPDEDVYILDYSIEPNEMSQLLDITKNVVWVDHHKSAIEKYEGYEQHINGIRAAGRAGCVLAYDWLWGHHQESLELEPLPQVSTFSSFPPLYIKLIGDADIRGKEFLSTGNFIAGLQAEKTHPSDLIWQDLKNDGDDAKTYRRLCSDGQIIQRYKNITQQEYLLEHGFWTEFHGHRCYAVNGKFSSHPFEVVVPDAAIWLTFRFVGNYWIVRLYSHKGIDVSEIAKEHEYSGKKGGGHQEAAGFTCRNLPFEIW